MDEEDQVHIAESFDIAVDDSKINKLYPLSAQNIAEYQKNDKMLQQNIVRYPAYFSKAPIEGVDLTLFHKKIYIPRVIRGDILEWYHTMLCHPGAKRTERSIRQHLTWPGLTKKVHDYVSSCHQCQRYKFHRAKYGYVQPNLDDDAHPWHAICVYEIGPYNVTLREMGRMR